MDLVSDCVVIYGSWLQGAQGTPQPFLDNRQRFIPAILRQMSLAFHWAATDASASADASPASTDESAGNIDAQITVLARYDISCLRCKGAWVSEGTPGRVGRCQAFFPLISPQPRICTYLPLRLPQQTPFPFQPRGGAWVKCAELVQPRALLVVL